MLLAGATILVEEDAAFHISMKLAAGKVPAGAAWGMRVDYYSPGAQAYPTNAAHLYLQHNVSLYAPCGHTPMPATLPIAA